MSEGDFIVTNLELRESNPDGSEGAGLSHSAAGLFLLQVSELASVGEPRGAVTIVHDAGGYGRQYGSLAQVMSADGWIVALPDMRGSGSSEGPRGHSAGMLEVARDLDSVQDHLSYRMPFSQKVLIGVGLGGLYALSYALDRPDGVAAVVSVGPLLSPKFQEPAAKGGIMGMFKKSLPTDTSPIGFSPEQQSSLPDSQALFAGGDKVHDCISRRCIASVLETAASVRSRASSISVPTLILQGTEDPLANMGDVEALAGGKTELRKVEGARHQVFHDKGGDEEMAFVRSWVDGKLPRSV